LALGVPVTKLGHAHIFEAPSHSDGVEVFEAVLHGDGTWRFGRWIAVPAARRPMIQAAQARPDARHVSKVPMTAKIVTHGRYVHIPDGRWRQLSELHVCLAGIQENHEYTSQFASYPGNLGLHKNVT
jgi:hypothetical protein